MAKCKHCKTPGATHRAGLSTYCNFDCAFSAAGKALAKVKVDRVARERKQNKAQLAILNQKISYWRPKADTAFQLFCRLRDYDRPCISCGILDGQMHGGHYISKGAKRTLTRYAQDNCHSQCAQCNKDLGGNIACYRPNLLAKIGEHRLSILEGPWPVVHWKWWHYEAVYQFYNKINLKMRKELSKS
tara:strand:+ start:25394 stop:25954 length:561 start_codon:yes stop_codon:yes gene_type:complete